MTIVIIFGFIGLARGYSRELGNSILIMYTVAALGFVEQRFRGNVETVATSILGQSSPLTFLFLFFSFLLVVMVIASYSGITFNFGGSEIPGLAGGLISLAVGLLNGYLVAGTLWYYANLAGYPLVAVNVNDFSTVAKVILGLPPAPDKEAIRGLLPQMIFPSPLYWIIPPTVLMFLRVRG